MSRFVKQLHFNFIWKISGYVAHIFLQFFLVDLMYQAIFILLKQLKLEDLHPDSEVSSHSLKYVRTIYTLLDRQI